MPASRRGLAALAGRDAGCTLVSLHGEHDVSNAGALSDVIARAIALDDADLVFDLSKVEFMGAATIGVFVHASEVLRLGARSLTLRSPSTRARRVLDVCDLDGHLDPVDARG